MLKRMVAAAAVLGVTVIGGATVAHAYPIGVLPVVTTNETVLGTGEPFMAYGENYCPGQTASFYIDDVFQGTAPVDGNGKTQRLLTAPTVIGPHTVKVTAPNCDADEAPIGGPARIAHARPSGGSPQLLDVASTTIFVQHELPPTGSDSNVPLQAGLAAALTAAGIALVGVKRQRTRRRVA